MLPHRLSAKIPTLLKVAKGATVDITEEGHHGEAPTIAHLYLELIDTGNRPRTGKGIWDIKPLVQAVDGQLEIGEIAVLRALEADGWEGVWVCTFGGPKFWRTSLIGEPSHLPEAASAMFDRICKEQGGKCGGFFDVMAWREDDFVFVEYKGKGDNPNTNERKWISSALRAGIRDDQLVVVHGHVPKHLRVSEPKAGIRGHNGIPRLQ